jgi:hypothetical protein
MSDLPWANVPALSNLKMLMQPARRPAILVVYSPECYWSKQAQIAIDASVEASSKLRGHIWRYNAQSKEAQDKLKATLNLPIQYFPTVFVFKGTEFCDVHEYKAKTFDRPLLEASLK